MTSPRTTILSGFAFIAATTGLIAQDDAFKAPADVAAIPKDAEVTASGLASKVLKKGAGTEKPGPRDNVTVHYTGWQSSDGEMFDSSRKRGQPASFALNQVIAGWTEGLQLMVAGEQRRFWIPEGLAYGPAREGSGRPGGMLVFDVELIEFTGAPEGPKPPEGAATTKSGIRLVQETEGKGDSPKEENLVKFHFSVYGPDGKVMQSSKQRGEPQSAPLSGLPPFFAEPIAEMKAGGKSQIFIPGRLVGAPDDFVKADLELLSVADPIPAPKVPEDVAVVPKDAKKTESGLAYKVIKAGDGGPKPEATSNVTVHYSGWETSGEMFDSSVVRGEPTSFGLNQVIPGWTEGLQLMSKGDQYRFWIPEGLAYGPKREGSGRPGGLLVFDVELLEFE